MSEKWVRVEKGIRYKVSPTNKHGIGPDKYYVLRFTVDGEQVQEALGWSSEGVTLEKARVELARLREAHRTGEGPASLREKRQLAQAKREEEQRRIEQEAKDALSLKDYYENSYKPWAVTTKPEAFITEDSHWRSWLLPTLGNLPLRDIKLEQWDHLLQALFKGKLAERTREYVTGTLRRILKHAIERKVIKEVPPSGKVVGATAPKNNRRLRVLEPEELNTLLNELRSRDLYAWRAALFAALTGCRLGELAALTWRHVNLTTKTVTFIETKNDSTRTIPIESGVINLLESIPPGHPKDNVFVSSQGYPYKQAPSSFRSTVEHLGLNEGRPKREHFTFHSLRHGAATAFAKRMTLRELMDYMGWKVAAMALRYTHSEEAHQRAALVDFENSVLQHSAQNPG